MINKTSFDSDRTVGILLCCIPHSLQVKGKMPFRRIGFQGECLITNAGR